MGPDPARRETLQHSGSAPFKMQVNIFTRSRETVKLTLSPRERVVTLSDRVRANAHFSQTPTRPSSG